MNNDCVFEAWADHVRHIGYKVNLGDRLRFHALRYQFDRTLPGQITQYESLLDILAWMNWHKKLTFRTIETNVWRYEDFRKDGVAWSLLHDETIYIRDTITLDLGMFFSMNSHHAYFSQRYRGGDWICLAIQLKRR